MASSYTDSLRLTLPLTGELDGSWGVAINTGITELVDAAIAGTATVVHDNTANYSLTSMSGAADESRQMFLNITGALTAARNVVCPTKSKLYFIKNSTTGGYAITLKTTAGTGISVANGASMILKCDGVNVVEAANAFLTPALGTPSALVGTNITGTAAGLTAGNVTTNANLTGHVTSVGNAAVLGSFTLAQLNTAVSDADVATLAGAESLSNKTLVAPALGTPTSGVATNLTGTAASLTAGLASNLTGTPNITVGTISAGATTVTTLNASGAVSIPTSLSMTGAAARCKFDLQGGSTSATTLATSYSTSPHYIQPKNTSGWGINVFSGPSDAIGLQVSAAGAAAGDLTINKYGGNVEIGSSGAAVTVPGTLGVTGAITATGGIAVEAVIAPTLINSWANNNPSVDSSAGYWKDALGLVHIRGRISGGASGSAAFVLPAGYRPSKYETFPLLGSGMGGVIGLLTVESGGNVTLTFAGPGSVNYIDGITFRAA